VFDISNATFTDAHTAGPMISNSLLRPSISEMWKEAAPRKKKTVAPDGDHGLVNKDRVESIWPRETEPGILGDKSRRLIEKSRTFFNTSNSISRLVHTSFFACS